MALLAPNRGDTSPFLLEEAFIPGLEPVGLGSVPSDSREWERWKGRVIAYRELVRRKCSESRQEQQVEMTLCTGDPAYWMVMYGVLFEPRGMEGAPPRWIPWIPFHFQVQMIRWIQGCMAEQAHGRGDGIVEKSRDMGASWTFCAYIAHQWLFSDAFVAGVVSRSGDLVDKTGSSDTIFSKIRSLLGIDRQVPAHLRLPTWMMPSGFSEENTTHKNISHPSKTCIVMGENATEMAGVGGRATLRFNDEAARFLNFDDTWTNQAGTSNHRFAISSADTKSPGFQVLAKRGREALGRPEMNAPSYMRLDWWVHPFHTDDWYHNEKARFADRPHFFQREYDIDYSAGEGEAVYPRFLTTSLSDVPFDPYLGKVYCTIDPAINDPVAVAWIQHDTLTNRYRVIKGFQSQGGETPEFIASVITGIPISGYGGYNYSENLYPGIGELMEWTANLKRSVIYFGDHYGTHGGGGSMSNYYDVLREKSEEMTDGQRTISVRTVTKDDSRSHDKRKNALSSLASRMDFDKNRGAAFVLAALQESKYPTRKEGRAYIDPVMKPEHDEWSHMRSAIEYFAINLKMSEMVDALPKKRRSNRITMSGKARK